MTTLAPSVVINLRHPRARAIPKLAEIAPLLASYFVIRHNRAEIAQAGEINEDGINIYLAKVMLCLDPTAMISTKADANALENMMGIIANRVKTYDDMLAWLDEKGFTLANEFGAEPLVTIKYRDLRGMEFTVKLYME